MIFHIFHSIFEHNYMAVMYSSFIFKYFYVLLNVNIFTSGTKYTLAGRMGAMEIIGLAHFQHFTLSLPFSWNILGIYKNVDVYILGIGGGGSILCKHFAKY